MQYENDHKFLNKRTRLISLWNPVAIAMLVIIFALLAWLVIKTPYLVNPLFVAEAINQNAISQSTLSMSVMMLPVVVLFLFLVVTIFVLYGFVMISNEKRYLAIIDRLESQVKGVKNHE
ncbi:hypothetical protein [Thiomicrorhabdus sp. Milos-T2]|uniref:hypothetical protein n=1 Tax=Thiomicrorhabdus sp. Milos-T2 TaxID=90814 RepID=UPI000493F254|nr:hypothetical protein [Thiomicrorhabdus sp. Milos-T2]